MSSKFLATIVAASGIVTVYIAGCQSGTLQQLDDAGQDECGYLPGGGGEFTECPEHETCRSSLETHISACLCDFGRARDASGACTSTLVVRDETVFDEATGLVWERVPHNGTYLEADIHCPELELEGRSDWRVPSPSELGTIIPDAEVDAVEFDSLAFPNVYGPLWTNLEFAEGVRWCTNVQDRSVYCIGDSADPAQYICVSGPPIL